METDPDTIGSLSSDVLERPSANVRIAITSVHERRARGLPDEAELAWFIERWQAANDEAFTWLYERLNRHVLRVLRQTAVREWATLEDASQDVWLRVHQQRNTYVHRSTPGLLAWLRCIARNRMLDILKGTRSPSVDDDGFTEPPSLQPSSEARLLAIELDVTNEIMQEAALRSCRGPAERSILAMMIEDCRSERRLSWARAALAVGLSKHAGYALRKHLAEVLGPFPRQPRAPCSLRCRRPCSCCGRHGEKTWPSTAGAGPRSRKQHDLALPPRRRLGPRAT